LKRTDVSSTLCYTCDVRVFALPQVSRLLRKERLSDEVLCVHGRCCRDDSEWGKRTLATGLWKKRLARPCGGKSSGYRAIVAYRRPQSDWVLFAYIFAKNAASTLTPAGHEALSKAAAVFVGTTDVQLDALLGSR
jgi:hypothetical protein